MTASRRGGEICHTSTPAPNGHTEPAAWQWPEPSISTALALTLPQIGALDLQVNVRNCDLSESSGFASVGENAIFFDSQPLETFLWILMRPASPMARTLYLALTSKEVFWL